MLVIALGTAHLACPNELTHLKTFLGALIAGALRGICDHTLQSKDLSVGVLSTLLAAAQLALPSGWAYTKIALPVLLAGKVTALGTGAAAPNPEPSNETGLSMDLVDPLTECDQGQKEGKARPPAPDKN